MRNFQLNLPNIDASLSNREIEVLNLLAHEFNSSEIASSLYISVETVKTHRKNMLKKMKVKNVAGLIRVGILNGHILLVTD